MHNMMNGSSVDQRDLSLLAEHQYMREMRSSASLSESEEAQALQCLIDAYYEPHNEALVRQAKQARERLVLRYQPLVLFLAKKAARFVRSMEVLDLVNEGNIGLLQALDTYPRARDYHGRFTLFASYSIRQAVWSVRYVRNGVVRAPKHVAELMSRVRIARSKYEQEHGYKPSPAQLASILQVSEDKVFEAKECASYMYAESLQGLLFSEEDTEDHHNFVNLFASPSDLVEDEEKKTKRAEIIRRVLDQELAPRQREVVGLLYGFSDQGTGGVSPTAIAELLGIEPHTVRNIEQQARDRLQSVLAPLVEPGCKLEDFSFIEDKYYTVEEVSSRLGIRTHGYIGKLAQQGRLPAKSGKFRYKGKQVNWLFPKAEIDALAARRQAALSEEVA